MITYDTVVQALEDLKQRGYTLDFNIAFDKLQCSANGLCLNPAEFEVKETYRFEGETNPSDEDIVYAIEAKAGGHRGVLTSAYGMYADGISAELQRKLTTHR
jgi:hypothetical protein